MTWQTPVIAFLEASLVRPLVLVATAWLVLRICRVRHPASRHSVWTAVLIGMLLLPILSSVAPHWTLPVLPSQSARDVTVAPASPDLARQDEAISQTTPIVDRESAPLPSAARAWPAIESLIVGIYAAGFLAMLAYRLMGWALLRRAVSRSTSLRHARLRESAEVVAPVAVGVWQRSVILPMGWRHWRPQTKRAVLAHEFAHLRRGDTLVAGLARLVRSVLWFHPVAWWVSRQTSNLAELACDAVALQRVGDPAGYSRVLVAFAEAVSQSGRRLALPGLAIASSSRMSERIDQVFAMSGGTMRRLARPRALLIAVGIPALCIAATVGLGARVDSKPDGNGRISLVPPQATTESLPAFEVASIKPYPDSGTGPRDRRLVYGPLRVEQPTPNAEVGFQGALPASAARTAKAGGQATAGKPQKFDVASIKPGDYKTPAATHVTPSGVSYTGATLRTLIADAYGVKGLSMSSLDAPSRTVLDDRQPYDIEAKADHEVSAAELQLMLQSLLADRFKLTLHHASRVEPVYRLTPALGGPKLQESVGDGDSACATGLEGGAVCHRMTMAAFGEYLTSHLGRVVLDETKLSGRYDFTLRLAGTPGINDLKDAIAAGADPATTKKRIGAAMNDWSSSSIFTDIQKQLGLKLDSDKAPVDNLIIDHVERPTPNSPSPGPSR